MTIYEVPLVFAGRFALSVLLFATQALPEIGRFFVGCAPLFIALTMFDLVLFWQVQSSFTEYESILTDTLFRA